ncbi:MAG: class I SAM-dependent methyltransferase [Lachnospiraceae bacterium]|nr:class I SAM-dependent methyltransferase [Lachnospiraceae bacterium]
MLSDRYVDEIKRAQFDFSGKYKYIALFSNPYFFVRKHLYDNIKKYAPSLKGKVLDFGCGAKPYQTLFTNCTEYIGCDIAVSGHNHKNEIIDVYYDGKTLPFEDESFDSVFSSEVFEHVENLDEMLPELNRVLKKGGHMLITVPFIWNEHEIPYDFRRYTSYGLRAVLKKNGLKVVKFTKSTGCIEILMQMFVEHLRGEVRDKIPNRTLRILFQRIVITTCFLVGIVLTVFLPKNDTIYGDNIVLCKK